MSDTEQQQPAAPEDGPALVIDSESAQRLSYVEMRKTGTTQLAPFGVAEGAHVVVTTKEGEYVLTGPWEGAIALDADGDPYPVELGIVAKSYEEVKPPVTNRERAQDALDRITSHDVGWTGRGEARRDAVAFGLLALVDALGGTAIPPAGVTRSDIEEVQ